MSVVYSLAHSSHLDFGFWIGPTARVQTGRHLVLLRPRKESEERVAPARIPGYLEGMKKQTQAQLIASHALDGCTKFTHDRTNDLIDALAVLMDSNAGDLDVLYTQETILCEIDLRMDVDPKIRRQLARHHKRILTYIDELNA